MQRAEQELIDLANGGDDSAFEQLLVASLRPAHRFATAMLQDSALAEDAVQEASVLAWRKLDRLRPGAAFEPWFLGIVANRCREERRGRWWKLKRTARPAATSVGPTDEMALRRVELRAALMRLSQGEREVVVLRAYIGMSWHAVAAIVGLSEAGARTRYYRAIGRLRTASKTKEALT